MEASAFPVPRAGERRRAGSREERVTCRDHQRFIEVELSRSWKWMGTRSCGGGAVTLKIIVLSCRNVGRLDHATGEEAQEDERKRYVSGPRLCPSCRRDSEHQEPSMNRGLQMGEKNF